MHVLSQGPLETLTEHFLKLHFLENTGVGGGEGLQLHTGSGSLYPQNFHIIIYLLSLLGLGF